MPPKRQAFKRPKKAKKPRAKARPKAKPKRVPAIVRERMKAWDRKRTPAEQRAYNRWFARWTPAPKAKVIKVKKPSKVKAPTKATRTVAEAFASLNKEQGERYMFQVQVARLKERVRRLTIYRAVVELKAMYGKEAHEAFRPSKFDVQWLKDVTGLKASKCYTLCVSPDTALAMYAA